MGKDMTQMCSKASTGNLCQTPIRSLNRFLKQTSSVNLVELFINSTDLNTSAESQISNEL